MDMARHWLRGGTCEGCAVRSDAICGGLGDQAFAGFASLARRRSLDRGQVLIWEGDANLLVATLTSGALKLTAATADGREQIVGLAWPGDFVGNLFGARAGFRVTALSDAELCLFDRADFDAFVAEHPRLWHEILRRAHEDLDRTRAFLLLLGRMSAQERKASFLVDMNKRSGAGDNGVLVTLPLRRQEIADVLGLTIETVSRQLGRMRQAGIIALPDRRTIVVEDSSGLDAIAAG